VLRGLTRFLGTLVLLSLVAALLGVGWVALRIALYEQRDDEGALAAKAAALGAMREAAAAAAANPGERRPNFIVILFDDLGFGDLGAYRSQAPATPRLDRLAAHGAVFDTFYAAASYCTPSRAGLLTGRWPIRTGLTQVVFPTGHPIDRVQRATGRLIRLPADEITVAEALRAGGYATAAIGKWHLGNEAPSLPNDLGFERFFGVLHSNDMAPLPLWRDRAIEAEHPIDQRTLTRRYTEEAVAFVEANRERPFFLYLAHNFPHEPLHASPERAGKSAAGLYGDVLHDLDDSTGAILDALERAGLTRQTLVLVTSDNGPWFEGSVDGLRGRKNEVFEGGMRVPLIARWPGQIPAGQRIEDVASAVDLLPTLLSLAGIPLPADRVIDGIDLRPVLLGRRGELPERPVYYWADRTLSAVRIGRWKAHRRHGVYGGLAADWSFVPLFPRGPWLFDLARDPDESYDASARRPEELERLLGVMNDFDAELTRNPRGWRR
jgi:arylsulfatase A-like enzyme